MSDWIIRSCGPGSIEYPFESIMKDNGFSLAEWHGHTTKTVAKLIRQWQKKLEERGVDEAVTKCGSLSLTFVDAIQCFGPEDFPPEQLRYALVDYLDGIIPPPSEYRVVLVEGCSEIVPCEFDDGEMSDGDTEPNPSASQLMIDQEVEDANQDLDTTVPTTFTSTSPHEHENETIKMAYRVAKQFLDLVDKNTPYDVLEDLCKDYAMQLNFLQDN